MLNLQSLYSLNGEVPTKLPFRIYLSDGSVRTDPTTFTLDEITDAGFRESPEQPMCGENQTIEWNGEKNYWFAQDMSEEEIALRDHDKLANKWQALRNTRDTLISGVEWRISRHLSEARQGLPLTESIEALDTYVQKLRDITNIDNPDNVVWPVLNEMDAS